MIEVADPGTPGDSEVLIAVRTACVRNWGEFVRP
jgi:hypothetical protein